MKEKEILKFWVEDVLVGLNLSTLVKSSHMKELLDIRICAFFEEEKRTNFFLDALEKVLLHVQRDYSLLVAFPRVLDNFEQFKEWGEFLDNLITRQNLAQEIQLIMYHPDFKFTDKDNTLNPRVHLLNSSPYPVIYISKSTSNLIESMYLSEGEEKLKALSIEELKARYFWKKDLF